MENSIISIFLNELIFGKKKTFIHFVNVEIDLRLLGYMKVANLLLPIIRVK